MEKKLSKERVSKVIMALLLSPNKSMQRNALWFKLINLRSSL